MKLHLSGPMTGIKNHNTPTFNHVAGILVDMGYAVFNPATDVSMDLPYRIQLSQNLAWICEEAEGMVVLPKSSDSVGSMVEQRAAEACGLPIWQAELPYFEKPAEFHPLNMAAFAIGRMVQRTPLPHQRQRDGA